MAVSRMLKVQTGIGNAQLFCNDGRTVRIRISPNDSNDFVTVRNVKYAVDMAFRLNTQTGTWNQTEHNGIWKVGTYGIRDGMPTPTAKKKIDQAMQEFINSWVTTDEAMTLLAETEIQDKLETLKQLTKKETELKAELEKLQGEIRSAFSEWEEAKEKHVVKK